VVQLEPASGHVLPCIALDRTNTACHPLPQNKNDTLEAAWTRRRLQRSAYHQSRIML
jgi:hypothetical protein